MYINLRVIDLSPVFNGVFTFGLRSTQGPNLTKKTRERSKR